MAEQLSTYEEDRAILAKALAYHVPRIVVPPEGVLMEAKSGWVLLLPKGVE
jgi:hypothetical protein